MQKPGGARPGAHPGRHRLAECGLTIPAIRYPVANAVASQNVSALSARVMHQRRQFFIGKRGGWRRVGGRRGWRRPAIPAAVLRARGVISSAAKFTKHACLAIFVNLALAPATAPAQAGGKQFALIHQLLTSHRYRHPCGCGYASGGAIPFAGCRRRRRRRLHA